MKRLLKYFLSLVFILAIASCEKEFTPGNTAVVGFAGEWYYQLQFNDGTLIYDYDYSGPVLLTYNASENVSGKLWVDDNGYTFPLKALMDISGDPGAFTGAGGINESVISDPDSVPVAGGVPLAVVVNDYTYVEILEGKIIKDGARVWDDKEKAVCDSIFLRLKFSTATLNYTSREVQKFNHADSTTSTIYIWEPNADFYQVGAPVDTLVVAGHRQTGWEVYL